MSSIAIPRSEYRNSRRTASHGSGLNRLFGFIILFLAIVLVMELAFHFFVAPKLLIRNIELNVGRDFPISNKELLQAAGLTGPTYYYSVSTARIETNLGAYPLVKKVTVRKVFPNGLRISITERKPLVISLADIGGQTVPVAFDSEGVAVEVGESVGDYDMPIISGVAIPTIKPGMKLPHELVGFLENLQTIKNDSPLLLSQISEIKFQRRSGTRFDAILYPSNYRVPVIIGDTISVHQLKYIMMVLDVVQKQGMTNTLQDLDFRTGQVVYKLKEGSQSASG